MLALCPNSRFAADTDHTSARTPFALNRGIRAPLLTLIEPGHPERDGVEQFVRSVYANRYAADVRDFTPFLVALRDEGDTVIAAAGYRPAARGPLFLERYLPAPVETLLGHESSKRPGRERVVEVGHLAAIRAGAGRELIRLLAAHLSAQSFHWVVSTVTEELRHLFVRLGVAPLALGVADPAVLGPDAARWGRYYDHHPVVLAGHIEASRQVLDRRSAKP